MGGGDAEEGSVRSRTEDWQSEIQLQTAVQVMSRSFSKMNEICLFMWDYACNIRKLLELDENVDEDVV
jgi:hypothetical protein